MPFESLLSSARDAWFAVVAGLVAGGVTLLVGPTDPSVGAGVRWIGVSVPGLPTVLAALVVGVGAADRPVETRTAGVWTGLGVLPAVWWLALDGNVGVVSGAATTSEAVLASVALVGTLVVSVPLLLVVTVPSVSVGVWIRDRGVSLVGRLAAE